jgi:hypothetical protein
MDKKTKYTINCAIVGAIILAIINAIRQLAKMDESPEQKFDWSQFMYEGGKGALIGGGIGLLAGAVVDEVYANQETINTDEYLGVFANSIAVNRHSRIFKTGEMKCEEIISFLEKEFKYELSTVPFQWGSHVKGTAIEGKSDFDIFARFYRDSFSLEDMYHTVYEVLKNKFKNNSCVELIKQKKSIGLIFNFQGEKVKIDVVPMRDIDNNPNNTASNLYVYKQGLFANSSFTKTNMPLQASVRLTQVQRRIIMILKKWKEDNQLPMSSYMIQLLVIKAYEKNKANIPRKLTDKLLMVLQFVADNISSTRLISIENSNNDVNRISAHDKNVIKNEAKKVIEEYEYHPNTIQSFFVFEDKYAY